MSLTGKVALVTGASRGIGRGIALQLACAGATVYITGRDNRATGDSKEATIHDTANEIIKRGGYAIPIYCDHSDMKQVELVFNRIGQDQNGRLDILVNNVYSAVEYIFNNSSQKFWEFDDPAEHWDKINNVGLRNHYVCTSLAAKMMVARKMGGLIVNVSSYGGFTYLFNVAYGVGKAALDRMSADCAHELRRYNVCCVSLWPGAVDTEIVIKKLNSRDTEERVKSLFKNRESVEYSGKCIVHLAEDKNIMQKTGRILLTRDLGDYYKFKDVDGRELANFRSLKFLLRTSHWETIANWIPEWIRLPHWILALATSKF